MNQFSANSVRQRLWQWFTMNRDEALSISDASVKFGVTESSARKAIDRMIRDGLVRSVGTPAAYQLNMPDRRRQRDKH